MIYDIVVIRSEAKNLSASTQTLHESFLPSIVWMTDFGTFPS